MSASMIDPTDELCRIFFSECYVCGEEDATHAFRVFWTEGRAQGVLCPSCLRVYLEEVAR